MNRKQFFKNSLLLGIAGAIGGGFKAAASKTDADKPADDKIGYNHLPDKTIKKMNKVIHKADTRGHANHGWLNSFHTFSFASYHNPERMNFGVLRVLNDDTVNPGMGFGTHPHENMEIISIPLEGDLEHKDSMGNSKVIREGDIQVMSAGTGVRHSEYNKNQDQLVKFLQIWVIPNERNVEPRYDQIKIGDITNTNEFSQILSPNKDDQGVWIHQDAWFQLGEFTKDKSTSYKLNNENNGVYAFVLEGEATIEGEVLSKRDGLGLWDTNEIKVEAKSGAKILLMEVPLNLN